jgi:hypothetical protein
LITPACFKDGGSLSDKRLYQKKFSQYDKDRKHLLAELESCTLPFYPGMGSKVFADRLDVLKLNWVTFEDLLGIKELLYPMDFSKNRGVWEKIITP